MHLQRKSIMANWLQAARIPSQLYLALSLLMGHALYFENWGYLNWSLVIGFGLFGICLQLYIVFGNDVADFETDKLNQTSTIFSGGSRVLVEKALSIKQLKKAYFLMLSLSLCLGTILSIYCQSKQVFLLTLVALLLLWMYSYPPIKLSYRGGGEILQAIGLGLILPCMAFIGQGGQGIPLDIMLALIPSHLACAIGTSLADEPSDRLSQKRTFTVIFGQYQASFAVAILQGISTLLLLALDIKFVSTNFQMFSAYFLGLMIIYLFFIQAKPGEVAMNLKIFISILYTQSLVGVIIWSSLYR